MARPRRRSPSSDPYRSEFERGVATSLSDRCRFFEYESLHLSYEQVRMYTPDFIIRKRNREALCIEVKGYLKPSDRAKLLTVRRCNPLIDLRLVFQRASNKLSAKSKVTYGEWATKHNFQWAEGMVPDAWLEE